MKKEFQKEWNNIEKLGEEIDNLYKAMYDKICDLADHLRKDKESVLQTILTRYEQQKTIYFTLNDLLIRNRRQWISFKEQEIKNKKIKEIKEQTIKKANLTEEEIKLLWPNN